MGFIRASDGAMSPNDDAAPRFFTNFAYGSNMSTRRLCARTPSAKPLGVACLSGHRLSWHKVGVDGSAKCDILETGQPGDLVWGVLYRIPMVEKVLLDQAEGLGRGYEYKVVDVTGAAGPVTAGAYYATDVDALLQPYDWYLGHVVAGAVEHGLPASYQDALRRVAAVVDPDAERREINLSLYR